MPEPKLLKNITTNLEMFNNMGRHWFTKKMTGFSPEFSIQEGIGEFVK